MDILYSSAILTNAEVIDLVKANCIIDAQLQIKHIAK